MNLMLFWILLSWVRSIDVGAYTPQPNVLSDGKKSGLYIWIHLKEGTDVGSVMRKMAAVHNYVDDLCPTPSTCRPKSENDEYDDEVLAGVGFGLEFYSQAVVTNRQQNYTYESRTGVLGALPYTGGDIFVHAKSNSYSKLFELSQIVQKNLPPEAVADYRDTYGFTYKEGRDLSGFIDGTENPTRATRLNVALDPETNGSYCLSQEWVHNMGFINSQSPSTLEGFVGRKLADSAELQNKSVSSHVARMTSGPAFKAKKPVEIYRQSMPYGTLGKGAGLFFIAFSSTANNFDFLLSRMAAKSENASDDIMRISRCVSGAYWYFPSMEELQRLQNSVPGAGAAFRTDRPRQQLASTPSPVRNNKADSVLISPSSTNRLECISKFSSICFSFMAIFGHRLL